MDRPPVLQKARLQAVALMQAGACTHGDGDLAVACRQCRSCGASWRLMYWHQHVSIANTWATGRGIRLEFACVSELAFGCCFFSWMSLRAMHHALQAQGAVCRAICCLIRCLRLIHCTRHDHCRAPLRESCPDWLVARVVDKASKDMRSTLG